MYTPMNKHCSKRQTRTNLHLYSIKVLRRPRPGKWAPQIFLGVVVACEFPSNTEPSNGSTLGVQQGLAHDWVKKENWLTPWLFRIILDLNICPILTYLLSYLQRPASERKIERRGRENFFARPQTTRKTPEKGFHKVWNNLCHLVNNLNFVMVI